MIFWRYSTSIVLIIILTITLVTGWDEYFVVPLNAIVLFALLNNLGKAIVLREIISLYTTFSCLLMPLVGYNFYNTNSDIAVLWQKFMPVARETYFAFTVPAVTGFVMALCFPISQSNTPDYGGKLLDLISTAKRRLVGNHRIGVYLLVTGVVVTVFLNFIPSSLRFFFTLIYFSAFAGLLYVYFSEPFPLRKLVMLGFVAFILFTALRQGMFTIVVYMGMTLFPFFFIGKNTSLVRKLAVFILGVFIIALIQSVKPAYRLALWKYKYQGNKVELFYNLIGEKLEDPRKIFDLNQFFFIYYRTNQGYNIALVMKHIPAKRPFDNGENLFVSIASSFVPRFLWPDKPEAGGKANMKYYTGFTIKGWATNVGPLGEAYGSFGALGGVLYMLILGLVIRFFYARVFVLAQKIPLIIFWLPVLFYQVTYSAENDTLQVLNSLIKTSVFIFILYKSIPIIFKPERSNRKLYRMTATGEINVTN